MQKKVIALAVAGLVSGAAFAQSNVTIYGVADVGVEVGKYADNAGISTRVQSGQQSGSRLGFKGEEVLGNGLKALFVMEAGISMDTGNISHQSSGAPATTSTLFGRQSYAGLESSSLGTLTFGRQYSPFYRTMLPADAFSYGLGASMTNTGSKLAAGSSRLDNAALYVAPQFVPGLTLAAAYSSGGNAGAEAQSQVGLNDTINKAGRAVAGMAHYANGPIYVGTSYTEVVGASNGTVSKSWTLAGTYDFGVAKLFSTYASGKTDVLNASPTAKADEWSLGVKAPFGPHAVTAQYTRLNDKLSSNKDYSLWGVGYEYAFTKRTNLYTSFAKGYNKNGAAFGIDGAGSGVSAITGVQPNFNPWNLMTGIRHTF